MSQAGNLGSGGSSSAITGTLTAHEVVVATGTNTVESIGPGSTGQVLQSNGGSADPSYSTATYPSTAGSSGTILQSNGTNFVNTSSTYPTSNNAGDLIFGSASNALSTLSVDTRYGSPVGSNGTNPIYLDRMQYIYESEDFINGGTVTNFAINQSTSGTAGTSTNPGVWTFGVAVTNNFPYITKVNAGSAIGTLILGGGFYSLTFVGKLVQLSNSTNRYIMYIGFLNKVAATPTSGVYFTYSDNVNSGNWQIVCNNAGTTTTNNTSTAADTNFHRFRIDINAAGTSASFYIDDVQVANSPITSNFPTAAISPTMMLDKTVGSGTNSFSIDLYTLYIALTASR